MSLADFICGFLGFGCLVCLLFLIRSDWRKRRKYSASSAKLDYTFAGWVMALGPAIALSGGLVVRQLDPDSRLGTLMHGDFGIAKWWLGVGAVFTVIRALLRHAAIALRHNEAADGADGSDKAGAPTQRPSGFRLATIRGVPVFVHPAHLFGILPIAMLAWTDIPGIAGYCVAYAALTAIHEMAHAVVARELGLQVFSLEISGNGGLCLVALPRRAADTWRVYAAGTLAQALLLSLTLAIVAIRGRPESTFGTAVVNTFTWVNALMLLHSLIPDRSHQGHLNDGAVLWGLARHQFGNEPHPLASYLAASPVFDPATRLLGVACLVPEGFRDGIEILNDDTTPMAFVVEMLEQHAGLYHQAATAATADIHARGGLLLPLPDRAAADAVAAAIARDTHAQGHRLVCRAVTAVTASA